MAEDGLGRHTKAQKRPKSAKASTPLAGIADCLAISVDIFFFRVDDVDLVVLTVISSPCDLRSFRQVLREGGEKFISHLIAWNFARFFMLEISSIEVIQWTLIKL